MNIGVMNKTTSKTVYTYVYDRFKTFAEYPESTFAQYEIEEGTDQRAYIFNGHMVVFNDEWTAPPVDTSDVDKVPKIYTYTKAEATQKHFHNINYTGKDLTLNLIPKRTIVQGEVQKVEWYSEIDGALNVSNKVLDVDIVYTRDVTGFAIYRVVTRTWYNNDGIENDEKKITVKYYAVNPSESIDEGIKRRSLIIKELQRPILASMLQVLVPLGYSETAVLFRGRTFLDEYEVEFQKFTNHSSSINDPASPDYGMKAIIVKLRDESDTELTEWLDLAPPLFGGTVTIRQYIMSQLDVG